MYRNMLIVIDKNLVFIESDMQEFVGNFEESRRIIRVLAYYQPQDLMIHKKWMQLEMRIGDENSVGPIYETLIREVSYSAPIKLDLTQIYCKWLESRNNIHEALRVLEDAIELLNYDKLIIHLYTTYAVRHEEYQEGIIKSIDVFERTLKKYQDYAHNTNELIDTSKLYKSFLRTNCNEIDFVRKVESIINRRQIDYDGVMSEEAWAKAGDQ